MKMTNLIENGIIQSRRIEDRIGKIVTYKGKAKGLHYDKLIAQLSKEYRENKMEMPWSMRENISRMFDTKLNAQRAR